MNPGEEIDAMIAQHQDWRGATLAELRRKILAVEPDIIEEWKFMGAPVWSLNGMLGDQRRAVELMKGTIWTKVR